MIRVLREAQAGIPFLQLLLDETLCAGKIWIPQELADKVGGVNKKLQAKQKYELILRIAKQTEIIFDEIDITETAMDRNMLQLEDDSKEETVYGWQTDCYVIGKYSAELQQEGYFEAAVQGLLSEAANGGHYDDTLEYLEKMIGHSSEFYRIDDSIRSILIYKGDKVGHSILTVMAEQLGAALERAGEKVRYFDVSEEPMGNVVQFAMQRFKAVIGVQTYLFSIEMPDEEHYLHEYVYGPKYNFLFDHPIWVVSNITHRVPDFHILAPDPNYAEFAKRYFHRDSIFFPPAGMVAQGREEVERKYDITFVGNYSEYWSQVLQLHAMERKKRFLANRFLLVMRKNPNLTIEEAFAQVLEERRIKVDDEEFLIMLYEHRIAVFCVMKYYRDKVIRTLIDSGLQVDVFGNSWLGAPFYHHPNLIFHPDVTVEESLGIWKQSKCSLNVMSWHKGGFTERMAGIMMAGAVLVTDDTTYLKGRYDEDDMVIFQLNQLETLPGKIKEILRNDAKREQMAARGREKTLREHTWDKRAEQFLELLDKGTDNV